MAAFPEIERIRFEGPKSKNPLAYRYYDADEKVEGKAMKDILRPSVVYWHTFRGTGSDPFGSATMQRPWEDGSDSVAMALARVRVLFEFCEKLGAPFYAFHDRDVAPEGRSLAETNRNLDRVVKEARLRGVLTRALVGKALQVSPPFVITEEQIRGLVDGLAATLDAVPA